MNKLIIFFLLSIAFFIPRHLPAQIPVADVIKQGVTKVIKAVDLDRCSGFKTKPSGYKTHKK